MSLIGAYPPARTHKYEVRVPYRLWIKEADQIVAWLTENCDPYNDAELWDVNVDRFMVQACFYFYYENHAIAFKLRWL